MRSFEGAAYGSLDAFSVYEVPMTSITQQVCKEGGVKPRDVWTEMDRREKMLGIAEKLPKAERKRLQVETAGHKRREVLKWAGVTLAAAGAFGVNLSTLRLTEAFALHKDPDSQRTQTHRVRLGLLLGISPRLVHAHDHPGRGLDLLGLHQVPADQTELLHDGIHKLLGVFAIRRQFRQDDAAPER